MSILNLGEYRPYKALSDCLLLTWTYLCYETVQSKPIKNVSEKTNKFICFPANFQE